MRLLFCVVLVTTISCNRNASTPSADAAKPHAITKTTELVDPAFVGSALHLWAEFGANEANADSKYTGKTVETFGLGKVTKTESGQYIFAIPLIPDDFYFRKLPTKWEQWFNNWMPPHVHCIIDPKRLPAFTDLKGQQVCRLRGILRGKKNDPDTPRGYSILIENCELVGIEPANQPMTKQQPNTQPNPKGIREPGRGQKSKVG